ncbi:MAG: DMT family transporter [Candidatus Heimdallarchaeota archaeon]|nr:DMT family transporter [Candidatus Heimdallarchaeota archaeon]MDH5645067.1 DMT family transporter [Candidatus Heimdallarchaeota archaeon]
MSDNTTKLNLGPIFISLAAILWTTDIWVRGNLQGYLTASQIVLLDHAFIIIIISPLIIKNFRVLRNFKLKEWFALLFIGIGGSALATVALTQGFFTGNYPFQYVAVVVLLQQTQPIIAIGLAHVLLKEKLPRYYYIFSLFALIGVYLIIFPPPVEGRGIFSGSSIWLNNFSSDQGIKASIYGLIAACLWGGSTVFGRYLLKHSSSNLDYLQMTAFRFFIAFIFLIGFVGFTDKYPTLTTLSEPRVIPSILYMALIVGLLSLVLYYKGLKTTHASISAISELAYPLSFYMLMPILLNLGNKVEFTITQLIGSAILVAFSTALNYNYGRISTLNDVVSTVN